MSGFPHSIVRARASNSYFSLERQAVDVSGIAIPSPRQPFNRGQVASIEPATMLLTNPLVAGNVDFRVVLVTPNGEFNVGVATLVPQDSAAIAMPPIVPGEEVRVDLLATSDPGSRLDVACSWCDVDTVRRTTAELSADFADVLVPGPDEVLVPAIIGGFANAGPNLDIALRVIDEDGEVFFIGTMSTVPGGGINFTNFGPTVKSGQRLQARAAAGSGYFIAYVIDRPED